MGVFVVPQRVIVARKTRMGMVVVSILGGSPQRFSRVVRPRVDVRHKKMFCCCDRHRTDGPSYRAGATKRIVSISRTPTCLRVEPCFHPEERNCQQPVAHVFRSTGVRNTAWRVLLSKQIHSQVVLPESVTAFVSMVVDFSSEGTG